MLQAVAPLAFISIPVFPLMHAIAIGLGIFPLPYVAVSEDASPYAIAFLNSVSPFSIIHFSIRPEIDSFSMCLAIFEITFIFVSIAVPFEPSPMADVICPLTLVNPIFFIEHDSQPMSLPVDKLAPEQRIRVFLDPEVFLLANGIIVEYLTLHFILF
jgi:hypothetical protein